MVIDRTIMMEAGGERIMNSRERVLLAINHEEADRLPMFRPNMIQTYEPLDERVQNFLDTFEFDRFAGVGFIKARPEDRRKLPDGVFEDSYGCKFKYMGVGLPYSVDHKSTSSGR